MSCCHVNLFHSECARFVNVIVSRKRDSLYISLWSNSNIHFIPGENICHLYHVALLPWSSWNNTQGNKITSGDNCAQAQKAQPLFLLLPPSLLPSSLSSLLVDSFNDVGVEILSSSIYFWLSWRKTIFLGWSFQRWINRERCDSSELMTYYYYLLPTER